MERRKAREAVMELLFEREFKKDEKDAEILRLAEEAREFVTDKYMEKVYFGVIENADEIDKYITDRAIGWSTGRMTKISLSAMRIAVYEMLYCEDIPFSVSINEAVEIVKNYDEEMASSFVNGILNRIAEDLGLKKK